VACATVPACVIAVLLAGGVPGTEQISRAASGPAAETNAQSDDSVPAREVTMIGATPAENGADETWGVGKGAGGTVVVRYALGVEGRGEWTLGPDLQDQEGQPLSGFELDTPEAAGASTAASPLAGQMTADGAGALGGYVQGTQQVLLVREPDDPDNPFRETNPSAESQLQPGERLLSFTRAPLLAPLDEGGHAGVLVVPVREPNSGVEETVLHWEGASKRWSREPIELPASASSREFRMLGIGASSPSNAWLLAQLSAGTVALFQRQGSGSEAAWRAVALKPGGQPGEPLSVDGEAITIPGAHGEQVRNQVLTVTSQGVWIDGERPNARASTTIFFRPQGEGVEASITSWCSLASSPPGTSECDHTLPEALTTGPSRSIAWANDSSSTPFGERVITGLAEGVSLRLEGASFRRVLALGGSSGSAYGAAFSNPREGWLGAQELPVHLTLAPTPSGLTSWPVPFRHALVAIAPQPGEPIGSVDSQALAVGDLGEVARFEPGLGWLPESLIGANGRRQTPRLRAVAWPVANRAYAVGDEGQMWLWRGETERWEPDPAAPYGFEGNLLGIAFDPNEPARGYAVGQDGVLLSYGKSWTQAQLPAESPCQPEAPIQSSRCTWSDTSFTSIAFAGSEAIVAYRVLPETDTNRYVGGLLVNGGSGWHIDRGAAEAMGTNVPWATAGLPDGGAAFSASGTVYEREDPGAQWTQTATPFPGAAQPGSLSLFREGGALRAVVSGSVPDTYDVEKAAEAPPGSPPSIFSPYPLPTNDEAAVLRQTAGGWRDEEHERNEAREPVGNWSFYDMPYQPDQVFATLIDPSGSNGWAVGGLVESEEHEGLLDTAVIDRLGESAPPLGTGTSAIPVQQDLATFAIGGNAQCAAPCAVRANTQIGPDVWLSTALQRADLPGVRAFLYTGPRLPAAKAISGPQVAADHFSYEQEFERYAAILQASPLPVFAASTPTDLDASESELSFEQALGSQPLGGEEAQRAQLSKLSRPSSCSATPACQSSYFAFTSNGTAGAVRVIVLDDASETGEIEPKQRHWLASELAAAAPLPAIVVGHANLGAQMAANNLAATEVVRTLVEYEASAYFFDAPEENISETLHYGSGSVLAFGSGTLGYVSYQGEKGGAFLGDSGFLLAQVNLAERKKGTNIAPVTARLIPNIGELALEAKGGTLLRRSQAALFSALARRPLAGNRTAEGGAPHPESDPYITFPTNCVAAACANALQPEYTFTSSRPEIGDFVEPNLASSESGAVKLQADGKPIPDPTSGLFCAYNAGTTIVTISAGGLSASLPVTVEAGSVREPCGTQPLALGNETRQPAALPTPAPVGPAAAATSPPPLSPPPLPAVPASPAPAPHISALAPPPLLLAATPTPPRPAALLPPPPAPSEPTPPSGTSAVNSPVEAAQREEDREEATESVSASAVAYRAQEHEPVPTYLLGLLLLAAIAGASIGGRAARGRHTARVAPATIVAMRSQRRFDSSTRRRR
jgi:hypothetical protein